MKMLLIFIADDMLQPNTNEDIGTIHSYDNCCYCCNYYCNCLDNFVDYFVDSFAGWHFHNSVAVGLALEACCDLADIQLRGWEYIRFFDDHI